MTAVQRCLTVELASTPVLLLLISALPSRARESEATATGGSAVVMTGNEGTAGV